MTVRKQLAYFSEAGLARGKDTMERFWRGAVAVIEGWQCERLPDIDVDLDTLTDPKLVEVIIWTALEVKRHMDALDDVPKN